MPGVKGRKSQARGLEFVDFHGLLQRRIYNALNDEADYEGLSLACVTNLILGEYFGIEVE